MDDDDDEFDREVLVLMLLRVVVPVKSIHVLLEHFYCQNYKTND